MTFVGFAKKIRAEHLKHASDERCFYNERCSNAEETFKTLDKDWYPDCKNVANIFNVTMHYSFDFAQQLHYPTNPLQPGPIFFKTPRKAGLFGICCKGIPRQVNYIIDESVATGKGSNTTVSLLHSFFEKHGHGEKNCILHADNCGGQNKNDTVIQYLLWRIINGYHQNISYHFMIAGHTKFQVDGCFGLIKKKTSLTFISSLLDIADCVLNASPTAKTNYPELTGIETGEVLIPTYDWKSYHQPYFKKVKYISEQHHFRISSSNSGVVYTKKYLEYPEITHNLLKDPAILPTGMPEIIKPNGMSNERKQYLCKEIRYFCKEEAKDLVCSVI